MKCGRFFAISISPKPRPQPKPQVLPPPDPPINMLQDSQDKPGNNEDSDRPGENVLLRVLLTLGVAALIASLLAAPFVLIAWLKSRRRERRRHAPEVADRFSGAWAELEDAATDLGHHIRHVVASIPAVRSPPAHR